MTRVDCDDDWCAREVAGGYLRVLLQSALEEIDLVAAAFSRHDGVGDDVASIRALRLALRRTQYQVDALAPLERSWATLTMSGQLRDVGRPLGRLRDAEIVESRVARATLGAAPSARIDRLRATSTKHRLAARRLVDEKLDSREFRELLRSMRLYRVALYEPTISIDDFRQVTYDVLAYSWGRLERAVEHARADPRESNLHAARLAAKRVVVSLRTFALALDPSAATLNDSLDVFQRNLGQHRDSTLVAHWLRHEARHVPRVAATALSLALAEERRAERRRRRWVRLWKKVRDCDMVFPGPNCSRFGPEA